MNGYGRALVQRIAQTEAIAFAREQLIPVGPDANLATWEDGPVALSARRSLPASAPQDWVALKVWTTAEVRLDFNRSQLLWSLLSVCRHRVIFELAGNCGWIDTSLRCHRADIAVVRNAFTGLFPCCVLTEERTTWTEDVEISCCEEVNGNGYWIDRIPLHEELRESPLWVCVSTLLSVPDDTIGFYQCLIEPTGASPEWHRYVEMAHDLKYLQKQISPQTSFLRNPQSVPSGELRRSADEMAKKANGGLPFFGVVMRSGFVGSQPTNIHPMNFLAAYRSGGSAFDIRTVQAPPRAYREAFFRCGASCRPGILLNAAELVSVAHILPAREDLVRRTKWAVFRRDVEDASKLACGTLIGFADQPEGKVPIAIAPRVRERGTHMLSTPGGGKSTLAVSMCIQDAEAGNGVAFIDPRGDGVRLLMKSMPRALWSRCIYMNPGDEEWTFQFNPLRPPEGANRFRFADDILSASKRVSTDWGDRLEYVLRYAFLALLYVPDTTIRDVYNLIRRDSDESKALVKQILTLCPDEDVRHFWAQDFNKYTRSDLMTPLHKLVKLRSGGAVSRMFASQGGKFNIREIMDSGKILMVDLSHLGAEATGFIGSFMLTLFMVEAMSRAARAVESRRPFSIFADEGHTFVSVDVFENLMAQARKFGVNLVVAHQYLTQFGKGQKDALFTAGTTLIGRVDQADAAILAKNLQGKISAEDLTQLPPFEMVARIGTEIARFKLPKPTEIPAETQAEAIATITGQSRREYYVRTSAEGKTTEPRRASILNGEYRSADLSYEEF
jgi:hypothetical protein